MSESPRFPAVVDGLGRLRFDSPELWAAKMDGLKGKRVTVEVRREKDVRTIEQNRLLWWTYNEAVAEGVELVEIGSGEPVFRSSEDVHGWAKLLLLRRPVQTNHGELNLLGTTTTLTTEEFSRYLELLVAKLAQLGILIRQRGE